MKKKTKKTIINILMVLCILVALGCGGYLAYYYYTSSQTEAEFNTLRDMVVEVEVPKAENTDNDEDKPQVEMVTVNGVFVQKKFEKLYRANSDFIGWLTIDDTLVDYPVMYTPNDAEKGEFYIHRDFDMNYSAAGLPFIDRYCTIEYPTDNIIIYGHNMNSGTMFHDILKYQEKEFYEQHKTFTFDTIYGDGTYEVVAAFYGQVLPEESDAFKYYEFVNAGNEEDFMSFIDNIKAMSVIDTGVEVKYGDKLVTLSTCAYHVKDGRFAVIAKKIK